MSDNTESNDEPHLPATLPPPRVSRPSRLPKSPEADRDDVEGCVACGATPIAYAEFKRNTGMILVWRREEVSGHFCRSCGIGAFRDTTNHSLSAGWWGVFSFFGNFAAIGKNVRERRSVTALPESSRPNPATEGPPLARRPGMYVTLALMATIGFFVVRDLTTSDTEALDGKCVLLDEDILETVRCSSEHDGKIIAIVPTGGSASCPVETDEEFIRQIDEAHALCIDFDQ